jgi:hypothetical protein
VDVVVDAFAVAVLSRAAIVPPVLRSLTFREALPALVTEELSVDACISVEFELQLRTEGSLAVPADMSH